MIIAHEKALKSGPLFIGKFFTYNRDMKTPDFKSRAEGSMLGLAVGDALGAPVEFGHTSYDIRWEMKNLRHMKENRRGDKGIWTDDTSMALCIADSLLEKNGYDSYDLMEKYKDWMINGYRSYYPMGDGIGIRTQEAIETYIEDPIIHLDTPKTDSIGNGCIMRLAPIVIANFENTPENILEAAAKLSCRETHDSVGAMATTELMAASLYLVLKGEEKPKILEQAIQMVKEPRTRKIFSIAKTIFITAFLIKPAIPCATSADMQSIVLILQCGDF